MVITNQNVLLIRKRDPQFSVSLSGMNSISIRRMNCILSNTASPNNDAPRSLKPNFGLQAFGRRVEGVWSKLLFEINSPEGTYSSSEENIPRQMLLSRLETGMQSRGSSGLTPKWDLDQGGNGEGTAALGFRTAQMSEFCRICHTQLISKANDLKVSEIPAELWKGGG